jgi:hypothetical protein
LEHALDAKPVDQTGLLHTLFAFAPLYRGLFQLWTQHFAEHSDTAWRDDSQPMALVRSLLTDFQIDWDKRCSALKQPFDRSSRRGEPENRRRPWSTGLDVLQMPLIDSNVAEVLGAGLRIILGCAPDSENFGRQTEAVNFGNTVMLGSIVYLRQAQLAMGSRPNLAQLEQQYLADRSSHGAYQFLEIRDAQAVARACGEFAQQQAAGGVGPYIRDANRMSLSLRRECNRLVAKLAARGTKDATDRHRDELLRLQLAEQRLCALLHNVHRLGGQEPVLCSQVDFVLPGHLDVRPTDYYITYDTTINKPVLLRVEPPPPQGDKRPVVVYSPAKHSPPAKLTASMVPPPVVDDDDVFRRLFAEEQQSPPPLSVARKEQPQLCSPRAVDLVRRRGSSIEAE